MRDLLDRAVRRMGIPLALLMPFAIVGCGKSTGTVSGTVTLDKEPLASGTITFVGESGEPQTAGIVNGKYETDAMPVGNYKVMIHVRDQSPPGVEVAVPKNAEVVGAGLGPVDGNTPPAFVKPKQKKATLDPRYSDSEKSGLTTTVKTGPNTFDAGL